MESQTATRTQAGSIAGRLLAGLTVTIMAGFLSQSAVAANGSLIDCERLATSLRSLDIAAPELPLETVDHVDDDNPDLLASSLETETVAPVLLLTPRVADIMREVFNALPGEVAGKSGDDDNSTVLASDEPVPMLKSPTASQPPPVSATPAGNEETSQYMPRFQRQMYRTDI